MSEDAALEKIHPPPIPPPDQPDQKAKDEVKEFASLTATQREQLANRNLLATLNGQIEYLKGEKHELSKKLDDSRETLVVERKQKAELTAKCAQIETAGTFMQFFGLFGQFLTLASAISLGIAGSAPDLGDSWKTGLTWGGAVAGACGFACTLVAVAAQLRTKPKA